MPLHLDLKSRVALESGASEKGNGVLLQLRLHPLMLPAMPLSVVETQVEVPVFLLIGEEEMLRTLRVIQEVSVTAVGQ